MRPPPLDHPDVTVLASWLEGRSAVSRVTADVDSLAASPRGRHHPAAMEAAQRYVTGQLSQAGWRVTAVPFERRWVIGVSDAGGDVSILRRLRLFRRLHGVNLLAELPDTPSGRRVLIVAHLDSVACSPGADDNASGVAALIECARLLAELPEPVAATLAVVDMEELAKVGSGALARDRAFTRDIDLVVCLESVGTYDHAAGTQKIGGMGLLFRDLARHLRRSQYRGDFLLAVCRSTSATAAHSLTAAAEPLGTRLPVLHARDPRPDGWRGRVVTWMLPLLAHLDRSDHAPFWSRGVPAMMLTTTASFRNAHYHRPGDVAQNVDCPRVTALAVALAATVATRFGKPRMPTGGFAPGMSGDPLADTTADSRTGPDMPR